MIEQDPSKSYVHGASNVPLLFETIGERLKLAAKLVRLFYSIKLLMFLKSFLEGNLGVFSYFNSTRFVF
jgi:hypothetical protein